MPPLISLVWIYSMKRLVLLLTGFANEIAVVENPSPELLQAIWRVREATETYRAIPPHPTEETSFQCQREPLIEELDYDHEIMTVQDCDFIAIEYCPIGDGYSLCCPSQEQLEWRRQEREEMNGVELEGEHWTE